MEKAKARKLVGKPSMSQVLYQEALGEYEVPRAEKCREVREGGHHGIVRGWSPGDSVARSGKALGACGFDCLCP